jgi:hypothetical protein
MFSPMADHFRDKPPRCQARQVIEKTAKVSWLHINRLGTLYDLTARKG